MKNRKNNPISFGITLAPANRTEAANTDLEKRVLIVRRGNALPRKTKQVSMYEFDCPRTKMPTPAKPFTPDMFNCEARPLPHFPPPRKISPEEERIHKELERSRSRTAQHSAWGKSFSMAVSVLWEIFTIICVGFFIALKYIFIAAAAIITIGCMLCAGRQTTGLR